MTCNPKWKEITENLESWQKREYRPDLVARVFHLKLKSLLDDINNGLFGTVKAIIHVIEFQKRGLPHAHILLILNQESKIREEKDVDAIVWAEIPDKEKYPVLHDIVTRNMIHTPCGIANPKSPCMDGIKCTKGFPKEFRNNTMLETDGYPKYKRRQGPKINNIDNSWVVPYNPYLLKKYNCHINVEVCASVKSVKYLFKYVYKGHDCANVDINITSTDHDEVKDHVNARYVSSPEAMWRILTFPMHHQSHSIIRLAVHLMDEQQICFDEKDNEQTLRQKMTRKKSTLMAWFELNQTNPEARNYLYREIPEHFVFESKTSTWKPRKIGGSKIIGRMYFVSATDGERYFMRLLLMHVKGATDYKGLRSVEGVEYSTFKEAAKAAGLLQDDGVWKSTLEDAIVFGMPKQLRELFAYICIYGEITSADELWNVFKLHMMEDFCRRVHNNTGDCHDCEGYALREIEDILISSSKLTCSSLQIPTKPAEFIPDSFDAFMNIEEETKLATDLIETLNTDQKLAFDEIKFAIHDTSKTAKCFFIDGPGGSGKTYLYETLIHYVQGLGETVLPSATTGVAGNLLNNGVTMHSLYKLPVPLNETSVSRLNIHRGETKFIKKAKLLIIDECTMASNHAINTIDRLLREVMEINIPFGGKVLLLGGDFRQCLPIIPHGMRAAIVQGTLKFSGTWEFFRHLKLNINMRAQDMSFSEWLLKLGNGTISNEDGLGEDLVEIPQDMICNESIVTAIFGNQISIDSIKEKSKYAILCPKNDAVDRINAVIDILDGDYHTYMHYVDKSLKPFYFEFYEEP